METLTVLAESSVHVAHAVIMTVPVQTVEHVLVIVTASFALVNQLRDPHLRHLLSPRRTKVVCKDCRAESIDD